jgi:hypothetical protein
LKHAGTIQALAPKYIEKISSGVITRAFGWAIAGATAAVLAATRLAGVEFILCAGTGDKTGTIGKLEAWLLT